MPGTAKTPKKAKTLTMLRTPRPGRDGEGTAGRRDAPRARDFRMVEMPDQRGENARNGQDAQEGEDAHDAQDANAAKCQERSKAPRRLRRSRCRDAQTDRSRAQRAFLRGGFSDERGDDQFELARFVDHRLVLFVEITGRS